MTACASDIPHVFHFILNVFFCAGRNLFMALVTGYVDVIGIKLKPGIIMVEL
jgi:hypothetical protein